MTSPPQISEDKAEGKTKAVFDDIKATLQTPTAGFLFRRLAVYPWYLQLAWRNLKPNAATVYFHRTAGELREMAVNNTSGTTEDADLQNGLDTLLDLNSKLLLASAALATGANGQLPKMRLISRHDRETTSPVPHSVPSVEMDQMKAQQVSAQQPSASDDSENWGTWIRGDDDLRLLSPWSADLSPRWAAVKELTERPEFAQRTRSLREAALIAVEGLPFRMEVSATAARRAGLSEDQIDAVRAILNDSLASLPVTVLSLAALSGGSPAGQVDGASQALAASG